MITEGSSGSCTKQMSPQRPVGPDSDSLDLLCGIRKPVIHNMVSTVDLGCPIELRKLVLHVRSAEYNPRRFPGVVIRLREPRVTCLVFGTGRMVCTGARSEADANLGSRKCARIIQKLGFDVKFMNFTIQNMVGLADLRFPVRLEGVQLANEQMTQYEPEIFPALIYRIIKPRLVMLIFVNGKVVMTGAKSREHLYEALNNVYPILYNYRKIN
uniref:TATA box binding protein like 2 n=1 Tax=Schistosoma japonicum TaxID=6182 RepID=C1L442_SCHJA|nr:TATA box binding protein like 2 [Schistosoma japonicum]